MATSSTSFIPIYIAASTTSFILIFMAISTTSFILIFIAASTTSFIPIFMAASTTNFILIFYIAASFIRRIYIYKKHVKGIALSFMSLNPITLGGCQPCWSYTILYTFLIKKILLNSFNYK